LRNYEEHIGELEADRDALLAYYEKTAPEALDSLTPEERRKFYEMLRLEVTLAPDDSLELCGAAFPEGLMAVCETNTTRTWSSRPTRWTFRTRARSS
jgi:hypothetical protein